MICLIIGGAVYWLTVLVGMIGVSLLCLNVDVCYRITFVFGMVYNSCWTVRFVVWCWAWVVYVGFLVGRARVQVVLELVRWLCVDLDYVFFVVIFLNYVQF